MLACPEHEFCVAGSSSGKFCANGTYSNQKSLDSQDQCKPCPAGKYCVDGSVTGQFKFKTIRFFFTCLYYGFLNFIVQKICE